MMNKETQFRYLFNISSKITDHYPKQGSVFLNNLIKYTLGNHYLSKYLKRKANHKIKKVKSFRTFLVTADVNIGDAVFASSGVSAIKKIFPGSRIDFVIKKSTMNLINGNPDIDNLFPIYNGSQYPNKEDISKLTEIANAKDYDLIFNFSPMIADKTFGTKNIISYTLMASELIKNEFLNESINNVAFQAYRFIGKIFHDYLPQNFEESYLGPKIYLPNEAILKANRFLNERYLDNGRHLVMLNPDSSSVFTRMPLDFQIDLIRKLTYLNCSILLGAGHTEKFLEQRILYSLTESEREKVFIIPLETELDIYSALIDISDIFISGDTGPLHLASARKYNRTSGEELRNKTSVISVFGGTPPRIYGYDSQLPGFMRANQDAPSEIFIAQCSCRNITCLNKLAKTCSEVRCFHNLDPRIIVSAVDKIISIPKNYTESKFIIASTL